MQREASNLAALVTLGLFLGTAALLIRLIVEM